MTPTDWESIQEIRKSNRMNSGSSRKKSTPTIGTGLFTCACCKNRLIKTSKRKEGYSYTNFQCRVARGGGCEQGYLNFVAEKNVGEHIKRAISIAAVHIASQEVPTKVQEPAELSKLKMQRDKAMALNDPDMQPIIDAKQKKIDELTASLNMSSVERQEAIRDEFRQLSDSEVLAAKTDDELRSVAIRYGLTMMVDNKFVCQYDWQRLGVTLTMAKDNDDGVIATVSAKPVAGIDKEMLRQELYR